jgi:DNA-binding response OmpR family regulator
VPAQSAPSTARSTSYGSILLVEEYDALAAAIRSALKKFAPQHTVNVARTLHDAVALLESTPPDLIIIDFDPSVPGLTSFLLRAHENRPDARAMIIASGIESEIASDFRRFGAVHFLPKPYDIADFGATVQVLLADTAAETNATLLSLGMADVTLAQCVGGRSTLLEIQANGKNGEIHIHDGQIVHAKTGKRKNGAALEEIFAWSNATATEADLPRPVTRGIRDGWIDIFFAALQEPKPRRVAARIQPAAAPPVVAPPPPPTPAPKTGKKIVVVDDTEMLLLFVEDALTIADPQFQITTAPNGMTGLKEIEALRPDLVLLDYSLPDINGDEVCRRLLHDERTARVPVLMMSGHVPEMTASAESFSNIVATIAKPFMSDALVALVQQTLTLGLRPAPKPIPAKPTPPPPVVRPAPPPIIAKRKVVREKTPPPPPTPLPTPVRSTTPPPQPEPQRFPTEAAPQKFITPVISKAGNEVVLGLYLEVIAMRLTPALRMGTIRARPSSLTVSLHVSPASIPAEIAFELGRTELDANNRVTKLRLVPTRRPFERRETRAALEVGALNVVPQDSQGQVQLTPSANSPMTMHLLAHLDLAGVELSTSFELGELILQSRSQTVRVTLGSEQTGVFCEIAGVRLDAHGRIAEMLLNPLK